MTGLLSSWQMDAVICMSCYNKSIRYENLFTYMVEPGHGETASL